MSNFIGPELVDIIAAIVSMICLVAFLRVWQPKKIWTSASLRGKDISASEVKPPQPVAKHSKSALIAAWTPWIILSVFVFIWGLPPVKAWLNSLFAPAFPMTGLHNLIEKMPPVVKQPTKEGAVYTLNLLSATGTGILLSAIVGVLVGGRLGYCLFYNPAHYLANPLDIIRVWDGGMSFHGGAVGVASGTADDGLAAGACTGRSLGAGFAGAGAATGGTLM